MRLLGRRRDTPRYMGGAMPYLCAAAAVSRRFDHEYIGTEHVLLAIAEEGGTPARVLRERGLSAAEIQSELVDAIGLGQRAAQTLDPYRCIAPRLKQAFEIAAHESRGCPFSPGEVLIGLASVEDSVAARILHAHGVTVDELRAAVSGDDPGPIAA